MMETLLVMILAPAAAPNNITTISEVVGNPNACLYMASHMTKSLKEKGIDVIESHCFKSESGKRITYD